MSFLDVEISRENGKLVITVYRKPIFSGAYTHFESFLPSINNFGMTRQSKESSINGLPLQCGNNTSFDEFTILTHGNKTYLLEIRTRLIIRNQLTLSKNISFATLLLIHTV